MQKIRKDMLEDKPIAGCTHCYEREENNASSFRLEAWDEQEKYGATSLSTGEAPVLRYVDLSVSNTCNNKCRMCVPALSTHWYSDAKKLGLKIPKGIIRNPFIENTDFSELCITSKAEVTYKDDIETTATTSKAKGSKCPVCWKINEGPCPRHS